MTINDLLNSPISTLENMPDQELMRLLAPYFPLVRTPALPKEKSARQTAEASLYKDLLEKNKLEIAKMKGLRK